MATSGAGGAVGTQQGCKVRKDFLAIIDDSGSMSLTDPNRLRVQGINVMSNIDPPNASKTLAVEEFGSAADPVVFPAVTMGPNAGNIANALNSKINADNGGTNYNAAFAGAKNFGVAGSGNSSNIAGGPRDAWIFLTDGGHNEGVYADAHKGGPVTEVVGLGSSIVGSDEARLQQIANDNGGTYQKATDASGIQQAFVNITADLNCQARPKKFVDTFSKVGQVKRHKVRIGKKDKTETLALTWPNPNDQFTIYGIRLVNKQGDTIAVPARKRKRRKLRIKKKKGATFVTVRVRKLRRGRLKFRIKAKKLATPGVPVQVTTQVSKRRKKH